MGTEKKNGMLSSGKMNRRSLALCVGLLALAASSAEEVTKPALRRTQSFRSAADLEDPVYHLKDNLLNAPDGMVQLKRDLDPKEAELVDGAVPESGKGKMSQKGQTFYVYTGQQYGTVSRHGIAVTLRPGVTPFFEVPVKALQRMHASEAQAAGTKSAHLDALKGILLSLKDKPPTGPDARTANLEKLKSSIAALSAMQKKAKGKKDEL